MADDNLAHNGFRSRNLSQMEALLLAQAGYPCPPDTRPPHTWVLSAGGVPVPPVPLVGTSAFRREVDAVRSTMTAEERADPDNAPNNTPAWEAYFTSRRAQAVASTNDLTPVVGRNNRDGRHRWWSAGPHAGVRDAVHRERQHVASRLPTAGLRGRPSLLQPRHADVGDVAARRRRLFFLLRRPAFALHRLPFIGPAFSPSQFFTPVKLEVKKEPTPT